MDQPVLATRRLLLRPFAPADADDVERLAGDRAIADTTLRIPHPYPRGAAMAWIEALAPCWEERKAVVFAVTEAAGGALAGAAGLELTPEHRRAELGYWIGVPFWNLGYATEAALAVMRFGFGTLGLHRIQARAMARNPASIRVLEKLGMTREGVQRGFMFKWGLPEDMVLYAVLAGDPRPVDPPAGLSPGAIGGFPT
ncbi:MAG TPA: GNAT family N-acetyltransferase [Candidatus Polarisedimenticolia bacterium]|nr:GNAT family N-acetyltransferase [Candidatus Polarisedimenticolia bacterium]